MCTINTSYNLRKAEFLFKFLLGQQLSRYVRKTINYLAQEQSAFVAVRIHQETEGCDIPCVDAPTV